MTKISFKLFLFILLGSSMMLANFSFRAQADDKVYTLSYSPGTLFHQLVRDRTKVLYQRAGLKAEFIALPHNRSLISANEGMIDGDVGRVPSVEEKYSNLVRVNVKLMDLNGAAYTSKSFIQNYTEDLLKEHRVSIVLGVRWSQKKMEDLNPIQVRDYTSLFKMLLQDRIDMVLATEASAWSTLKKLGDRAGSIHRLEPYVLTAPIYHYLNKKNQAIVPLLEKTLTEMNTEQASALEKTYVVYTGAHSPIKDILELRLEEAFRRIGEKVRFINTGSSERALLMANEHGDGDAMRVSDLKTIAPDLTGNLIKVPEPISEIIFCVYTKGKDIKISGWESLKGYRNGLRVGAKILEKNIPGQATILPDTTRLFKMLDQSRLDTVTEHRIIGDLVIKKLNLSGVKRLRPALVAVPGYCYLHKDNQHLIPKLAAVLSDMKKDGTFKTIQDQITKTNE